MTDRALGLRDAISVALEAFPTSALHDDRMLDAVHVAVIGWMKDYGKRLGVIFEDADLRDDVTAQIAIARTKTPHGMIAGVPTCAHVSHYGIGGSDDEICGRPLPCRVHR